MLLVLKVFEYSKENKRVENFEREKERERWGRERERVERLTSPLLVFASIA